MNNRQNFDWNKRVNKEEVENCFWEKDNIAITCHGEHKGRIVISGKFKNPKVEKQKNELIEENVRNGEKKSTNPEETLTRHFGDNGNSLTYYIERKSKSMVVKEVYCEPKNEIEVKSTKQNTENSESEQTKEISSFNSDEVQVQKDKHSSGDFKSKGLVWWGVGAVGLLGLVVGVIRNIVG